MPSDNKNGAKTVVRRIYRKIRETYTYLVNI